MLHGFREMCIPRRIVTDNMKSVVIGRAPDGSPIWQKDYEQFMTTFQFQTTLCQAYHPYTKGAVERLVRFVKENFLPGRVFTDLTDLNNQVTAWCYQKTVTTVRLLIAFLTSSITPAVSKCKAAAGISGSIPLSGTRTDYFI